MKTLILLLAFQLLFVGRSRTCAKDVVNDITQLNPIEVSKVVAPSTVEEICELVRGHGGPISIGGGRYSQGGQIATEGALFLDMSHMKRVLKVDVKARKIT